MTDNPKTMTAEWDIFDEGNAEICKPAVIRRKSDGVVIQISGAERFLDPMETAKEIMGISQAIDQARKEEIDAGVTVGFNNGLKCEYRHKVGDPICPECSMQGFEQVREMAAKEAETLKESMVAWHIRRLQPPREWAE